MTSQNPVPSSGKPQTRGGACSSERKQRITALRGSRQLGSGLLLARRAGAAHLARLLLPIHLVDDLLRVWG